MHMAHPQIWQPAIKRFLTEQGYYNGPIGPGWSGDIVLAWKGYCDRNGITISDQPQLELAPLVIKQQFQAVFDAEAALRKKNGIVDPPLSRPSEPRDLRHHLNQPFTQQHPMLDDDGEEVDIHDERKRSMNALLKAMEAEGFTPKPILPPPVPIPNIATSKISKDSGASKINKSALVATVPAIDQIGPKKSADSKSKITNRLVTSGPKSKITNRLVTR